MSKQKSACTTADAVEITRVNWCITGTEESAKVAVSLHRNSCWLQKKAERNVNMFLRSSTIMLRWFGLPTFSETYTTSRFLQYILEADARIKPVT